MKTEIKKVALYYDASTHADDMRKGYELSMLFKKAVVDLEKIISKPIEDYQAFKNDIIGYSINAIKKNFPKPFALGLDNETTFKMLSIDFNNISNIGNKLNNQKHLFVVDKNGKAEEILDVELYTLFASTPEHFERMAFCDVIIDVVNKAYELIPNQNKAQIMSGFNRFITFEPSERIGYNSHYILKG